MKFIKSILSIMIVAVLVLASSINASALEISEVESGIYEVQNDVYHENEIGMSMSRTYLDPTMKLEIRGGKVRYTIKFSGSDYMENYRILVDDKDINAEIVNEDEENHTIELAFETDTLEPNMKANIYVDAMGRDVEFDIITKIDTLNLIEKIEEPEVETVIEEQEIDSEVKSVSEATNNNTILYVVIGSVVVAAIIFFVIKSKK